jgi:hypothetical protein
MSFSLTIGAFDTHMDLAVRNDLLSSNTSCLDSII